MMTPERTVSLACFIDAVGGLLPDGETGSRVKEGCSVLFRTHGQEFVYLSDILLPPVGILIHIENQSF